MRKLLFRFSLLLPLLVSIAAILLFGIKVSGMLLKASASQEEIRVSELSEKQQQQIFIYENFGNYKTYKLMVRIVNCESGWKTDAVNLKSRDFGLFQISEKYWDAFAQTTSFADYKTNWKSNVLLAKYIYETQGISAWQWSQHCWK